MGDDTESASANGLSLSANGRELTQAQQNKLARDKEYQRNKRASNKSGRARGQSVVTSDDESVSNVSMSTGRRPLKRRAEDD